MGEARRRKLLGLPPRGKKSQHPIISQVTQPIVPKSKLQLTMADRLAFAKLLARQSVIKGRKDFLKKT